MVEAVSDHCNESGNEFWGVLIVGMDHDDDVSSLLQCAPVAGLLIAAIAHVTLVGIHPGLLKAPCDLDRPVMTDIIHDDNQIDAVLGQHLRMGLPECLFGVVGRHYHDDFLVSEHKLYRSSTRLYRQPGNRQWIHSLFGCPWSVPCTRIQIGPFFSDVLLHIMKMLSSGWFFIATLVRKPSGAAIHSIERISSQAR